MIMDTHIVIMAGGIGSRFWPMSTSDVPKQFVDIMGVGKSLLQIRMGPCRVDDQDVEEKQAHKRQKDQYDMCDDTP